ncbi:hypothetical protein GK047_14190 [Paenibacillus sp. SYP-B3998]|uniref:O-antigen ligase family protein n=1 Tax=Paenibacillus sp. SYP-B3998 TaxID=2678564 RepID=A0A6G3ZZP2_9BACL|nr:hypothetical protein [Paenibacillus sp. SYP-B3998]NEW07154.1 hypothetical protein [Paenibacillus sp. SYP-B3998]
MDRFIRPLIILLLIFSVLPFLPEALTDILAGRTSYYKFAINQPLFNLNLRYMKDYVLVLLLLLIVMKDAGQRYKRAFEQSFLFYYLFILLILYGVTVMAVELNVFSIPQVLAGLRPLLLAFVGFKVLNHFKDVRFLKLFMKVLISLLFIELLVIVTQFYIFTKVYGIVNPFSLRLIGTFGGIAVSGYFAVSTSCIVFVLQSKGIKDFQMRHTYLLHMACFLVAGCSGTRTAIIGCMLVILTSVVRSIIAKDGTKRANYLIISILAFSSIVASLVLQFVTKIADRGDILQVQLENGRIKIITDYITNNSLFNILFGKGIGYGTNASVILNRQYELNMQTEIVDGTINSIIMQYGFIVMCLVLLLTIRWGILFVNNKGAISLNAILLLSVGALLCFATNIFEQYVLMLLLTVAYYLQAAHFDNKDESKQQVHDQPLSTNTYRARIPL